MMWHTYQKSKDSWMQFAFSMQCFPVEVSILDQASNFNYQLYYDRKLYIHLKMFSLDNQNSLKF